MLMGLVVVMFLTQSKSFLTFSYRSLIHKGDGKNILSYRATDE